MPKVSATARTLACTSLVAIAAAGLGPRRRPRAGGAHHHPPALPGGPLHRVRRHLHRPRPERRAARRSRPTRSGSRPGRYSGQHRRRLRGRWSISGAYKADLNDRLSYALIFDQPLRADTSYGAGSLPALRPPLPTSLYDGSMADLKTYQITGVLAYDVNPNVKVFGGVRAQRLDAKAAVSFVARLLGRRRRQVGLRLSRSAPPTSARSIALRVALTYYSKISYDLDTDRDDRSLRHRHRRHPDTETDVDTPQSVQLDFQTGVAPKTLVFGYVRWVDWSRVLDQPADLRGGRSQRLLGEPRPLVDYADDWWTYNLGVGRQLTDALAGSLSVTWEPSVGGDDDLARPLRRPHHGDGRADLRGRPDRTSPAASPTASSATPRTSSTPTSTTARSGAPACASATPSDPASAALTGLRSVNAARIYQRIQPDSRGACAARACPPPCTPPSRR